jgi:predicted DNA-binding transcriptional regulator AlpA
MADDLDAELRELLDSTTLLDRELEEIRRLPLYPSIRQTAYVLGLSTRTVWRLIARGELATRRISGRQAVVRSSIEELVRRSAEQEGLSFAR